jgi:rhodanese-related sulfurtransferase
VATLALIGFYLYQKGIIFANFESLSPKEANDLLKREKNSTLLLDVRTEAEYKNDGYIYGAMLLPLQDLSSSIDKLQSYKNKKIVVYCRSGMRSVSASRILSNNGFKVYNLKGGINNWSNSGLDIKK